MSAALALGHLRKGCHHNFQDSLAKTTAIKTHKTNNKQKSTMYFGDLEAKTK